MKRKETKMTKKEIENFLEIEKLKEEKHDLEYKMQGIRNVLYDCFMTLQLNNIIKYNDKFYNDIIKAMN